MGTSNFLNRNASKIYAVLMNYETPVLDNDDNETDEMETVSPDSEECSEFVESLRDILREKGYSKSDSNDGERNYTGIIFAQKTIDKTYCGEWFETTISAIIRSGYYEGCNLDWELEHHICGNRSEPDEAQIKDSLEWNGVNAGMAAIHSRNALKWLEKSGESLTEELELVFGQVCDAKLAVVARFSNGETVYQAI